MEVKQNKRNLIGLLCLCLFFGCIMIASGCEKEEAKVDNEVESLKPSDDKKTKITVLVKYAFSINNFEKIVEERFDDIDLVQVGNFSANTVLANEYKARLEHDDLTDIVMTWPLDVGEKYWEDRLINLSGMDFTSNYKTSMLDSIASEDGSLYYIPGPAQVRGIVYNKTLFAQNNWEVPTNYDEFLQLCKTIEASGMRAYQLSLKNEEVLDTAFMSFTYGQAYSKPTDANWIENYDNGKGSFMDHFGSALTTFEELVDAGVYKEEDLSLTYADVQRNLYTRKTAMIEDGVQMTQMQGVYAEDNHDEFALMPFFNKDPQTSWARIYMTCYIGLNKHLLDEGNSEKYEKVLELLSFISTPEGQAALASDNEGMYSSLKNVGAPKGEAMVELVEAFDEGRYGIFTSLERSSEALHDGLAAMIRKQMSKEEVAALVDKANVAPIKKEQTEVYGVAKEDFTLSETGAFIADILKEEADSDFALFFDNGKDGKYNGKGVGSKIYKGEFSEVDLDRIFPDLMHAESGELWIAKMKGSNILKALENTMKVNGSQDWFYYASGLTIKFNPEAEIGKRIVSVTTSDGKKIQKDKVYDVAIMDHCVDAKYIESYGNTGISIKTLIRDEVIKRKSITPSKDDRFIVVK